MNDCLIIVPTRGRHTRILEFYNEFIKNSLNSDIIFVCDEDDEKYTMIPENQIITMERLTVPEKINKVAMDQANNYKYLGFLGDDHIPRTYGWDNKLMQSIPKIGIAYANDLYQKQALPTVCIMTSNIPKKLGYMAIPNVKHFYIDNAWKEWGLRTKNLFYHDDVIIEHMHPAANKASTDSTYNITLDYVNSDTENYNQYIKSRLSIDIMKINSITEIS